MSAASTTYVQPTANSGIQKLDSMKAVRISIAWSSRPDKSALLLSSGLRSTLKIILIIDPSTITA